MNANVEGMIRAAAAAYRKGDKTEARALLERAIELDEYNEDAWLWLSNVVESLEEQRTCLENVLVINPNNERARAGLRNLGIDVPPSTPAAPPAPPVSSSVFTDISFAVENSADTFGSADFNEVDSSWADSIIPTSSPSATYQGPELTTDDYDSWVDNLGISAPKAASALTSSPFGSDFDAGVLGYDLDEDAFEVEEPSGPPAVSSPSLASSYLGTPIDEDAEDDFGSLLNTTGVSDNLFGATEVSGGFDEATYTDPAEVELDLEEKEIDPTEYFLQIPAEIGPGRLPGAREQVSLLLVLGVIVLLGLNVGAGLLLAQQMAS